MNTADWFSVDRDGLRKLIEDRPRSQSIFELVQNAWDEASTNVSVELTMLPEQRGRARLVVSDDNPSGFADITHAYTMFAPSKKKGEAEKRGRFNLGEKLVLALCTEAQIVTTTGHVMFNADGTRTNGRERTRAGSVFSATIRMTKAEFAETCTAVERMIPPASITTTFNGQRILERSPITEFIETLPTVIADDEGVLRRSSRKTAIRVYEPLEGETAMIYELGIPVVESGDRFHIDIQQKVPLNQDRDNVPPAYLRTVRAAVLNATFDRIKGDDAKEVWIDHALTAPEIAPDAVKAVVTERYGDKVVTASIRDQEANKRAVDNGYQVIGGPAFSKDAWANIRNAGFLESAGSKFPTGAGIGGGTIEGTAPRAEVEHVPETDYTDDMRAIIAMIRQIGAAVLNHPIGVEVVLGPFGDTTAADYGAGTMRLNLRNLGRKWFDRQNMARILDLVIHELSHDRVADHFSEAYYRECTRIGGRVAALALDHPEIFALADEGAAVA